jgi:predicted HTH domain antitoxin
MSKILEDMRNETALSKSKEIAIRMIEAGKNSLEDIADYTELPLETVKELESQVMQLA